MLCKQCQLYQKRFIEAAKNHTVQTIKVQNDWTNLDHFSRSIIFPSIMSIMSCIRFIIVLKFEMLLLQLKIIFSIVSADHLYYDNAGEI